MMRRAERNTTLSEIIAFMQEFIDLRDCGDGGFMPVCPCGQDKGGLGTILLRNGEWLVRCPSCLASEPQDDIQSFETSEVITLTLSKYGRIVSKEPDGDGWKIAWRPHPGVLPLPPEAPE